MYDIHREGGMQFMAPLTLFLLMNLGLIAFVTISRVLKKQVHPIWLESIRQIGGLAFIWGILSTMIGLYAAFDDLSKMAEALPLNVIMGGLKVGLITALYGSIIFTISLVAYIALKIITKNPTA